MPFIPPQGSTGGGAGRVLHEEIRQVLGGRNVSGAAPCPMLAGRAPAFIIYIFSLFPHFFLFFFSAFMVAPTSSRMTSRSSSCCRESSEHWARGWEIKHAVFMGKKRGGLGPGGGFNSIGPGRVAL